MPKDENTVLVRGFGKPTELSVVQLISRMNAPDPTDDILAQRATGYYAKGALGECRGEVSLMIAIIDEALDTVTCAGIPQATRHSAPFCTDNKAKKRYDRDLALRWFFVDDPDDYFFLYSFRNICATLGVDVSYLRRGLRAYIIDKKRNESKYSRRRVLYRSAAVQLAKATP